MTNPSRLKKLAFERGLATILKNPKKHLPRLLPWLDRLEEVGYPRQSKFLYQALTQTDNHYYSMIYDLFDQVDSRILKTLSLNLAYNALILGSSIQEKYQDKSPVRLPNLLCLELGQKSEDGPTYKELQDTIHQAKSLGTYIFAFIGDGGLEGWKDQILLSRRYSDCVFFSLTQGSLIHKSFLRELKRTPNLVPLILLQPREKICDKEFLLAKEALSKLSHRNFFYGSLTFYPPNPLAPSLTSSFLDQVLDLGPFFLCYLKENPNQVPDEAQLDPDFDKPELAYEKIQTYRRKKKILCFDFDRDLIQNLEDIGKKLTILYIDKEGYLKQYPSPKSGVNLRRHTLLEAIGKLTASAP